MCTIAPSNEHLPEFGQVAVIFVPEESKLPLINKFNTNFIHSITMPTVCQKLLIILWLMSQN